MDRVSIADHNNCVELVSGAFKIAVTTELGPRVIGGFIDGSDNIFAVLPDRAVLDEETGFILYGGHRLWHAPEVSVRTYAADNSPVEVEELENGAVSFSSFEDLNRLDKNITIRPLGDEQFEISHTLINRNQWAIELAPWALSVMAPGGKAIIPQVHNPDDNKFQVDRRVNFWPYSDLGDKRFALSNDFYTLAQDTSAEKPFKFGCNCPGGWIAYVNGGTALVKKVDFDSAAEYPDCGSSIQSYSCDMFLEIETTGPVVNLQPGAETTHIEVWQGLSGVEAIDSDQQIKENLVNRIA